MSQEVAVAPKLELSQEINRGELAQKVAFAAVELSKIIMAVGDTFPELGQVIDQERRGYFPELNRIAGDYFRRDDAGQKLAQQEAKNAITSSLAIAASEISVSFDRLVSELQEVATKADIDGLFKTAEVNLQTLSRRCLDFVGSLHSAVRDNKEIISFEKYGSSAHKVIDTSKELHDSLFMLATSLYSDIHKLAGEVVIFALRDFSTAGFSAERESYPMAKKMIQETIEEISRGSETHATPLEKAERDSLRVALSHLDSVLDQIYHRGSEHAVFEKSLRGHTRTTSEVLTYLIPVTGDVHHLIKGMHSTHETSAMHALELMGRAASKIDSLLNTLGGQKAEHEAGENSRVLTKLLTARDDLLSALESRTKEVDTPDFHVHTLASFGIAGLDAIKKLLLEERSSSELKSACLDRLAQELRSSTQIDPPQPAHWKWFRDFAADVRKLETIPENEDTLAGLKRAYESAHKSQGGFDLLS